MRSRLTAAVAAAAGLLACLSAAPERPKVIVPVAPAPALSTVPGGVFYEVFVRSFQDSDGDGIGDLNGLTSRLDYLNDGNPESQNSLGVDGIWLMPVFRSPSYHGYDTTDYESINPDYGSDADFARLCDEAHRRRLKVILDLVVNHTGSGHPWFADAASSPSARHRDWYVWSPVDPGWTQPWGGGAHTWHPLGGAFFYGVFWSGMPDLNFRNVEVRREMERIAALWLSRGVDGFRLDAARHLVEDGPGALQTDTPETHAYWKEFAESVRAVKSDAILVGEAWSDTATIAPYYRELPLNFDFPLADAIVGGVSTGETAAIAATIRSIAELYPPRAVDAPFLTNHDQIRIATRLAADAAKLRVAAAVLLTLPGDPFLYYGEEIGMQNGPGNADEEKRAPMPWDGSAGAGFTTGTPWHAFSPGRETANVAAEADPASLLARYRSLIRLRRDHPALRSGGIELLADTGPVLAFLRRTRTEKLLVLHNLGGLTVTAGTYAAGGVTLEPVFADPLIGAPEIGARGISVVLPPHASGIWRVR